MRALRILRLPLAAAGLAAAAYFGALQWTGNVHTVLPGVLYRSATLPAADFEKLLVDDHIETVINLRGRHSGDAWYQQEREIAERHGVRLVDLSWSAARELTDTKVEEFYGAAAAARGPVLIHCRAGADRTGLAVALFLAHVTHSSEEDAEAQLSIRYGHIGIPLLSWAYAMNQTFERLEPSLDYYGL
ncbi:tyrosine-protein phosphatase [Aureimonas leprariae]|uniref:tyrosine-protein phosphatase n=1 Tax=Plantimonas leprariae TaxID=2615207 RepID=UPI001386C001|nr:tyrosine-protein phosphatase [Aureimonas leprariae]